MLRSRPFCCAAFRHSSATWLLAFVGLALLAASGSAQEPPPTGTAKPDPNVSYAEIWTPRDRTGTIHLHGGVFAPINAEKATSATLGARFGLNLGSHVVLGVLADYSYKAKSLLEPVESDLKGFEPQKLLAKVDAHLIPAMVFLEVKLTDKFPIVPYAGVGAGYEWLLLRAKDYRTAESAQATFASVAWQSYAGIGMRLSKSVRLDGELFYNGGTLARDVVEENGNSWRETVDAEGVGLRVGLNVTY